MTHDLIPLHHLNAGQIAEIGELLGSPEEVHRLQELGLRTGRSVQMVRGGLPCIIRVDDHQLCFREADAFRVFVRGGP